ncbi:murein hydrolase transporter LrgA [Pasteurellaceae bacterium 15-036681]|nr:murein hydrolase transporter LrgA [Pasteurellaceae bacterium 15-036681]
MFYTGLIKTVRFILALGLLFLILYLGKLCNQFIPIGIPESIWGLLILFTLLVTKLVKVDWIFPASRPLLRYMILFFLPICAGIVEQGSAISSHLDSLLLANFISTILSMVVIGYLAQWLFKKSEQQDD